MIKESAKQKQIAGAIKSAQIGKQKKQRRILEYNKKPNLCKSCNSPLDYSKKKNKFCSHSCAAAFNNLGVVRNFTKGINSKKECLFCKSETTNSKFCGFACQQAYNWEIKKNQIELAGKIFAHHTGKKYLKETRGDKCEICGIKKWNGNDITMIMDHIDGDSSNNSIPNLRLICPNCDSQLPTYKGRNKGNGRFLRRKRYAEGKSF